MFAKIFIKKGNDIVLANQKGNTNFEHVIHHIKPVYDANSRILILGSIPSPASRTFGFYYGHKQNLFWPLLADLLDKAEPQPTIEARKAFVLSHHIALWDVLLEADIKGAADSSIRSAVVNDFSVILNAAKIKAIFTTGKTAFNYYSRLAEHQTGIKAIYLPSTSPANRAAQKKPEFLKSWQQILKYIL